MAATKILAVFIISWTLKFDVIISSTVNWPLGTYTLPKPKSGCPHTARDTWDEAWRYQDLENDARQGSKFSPSFNMDAKIIKNDVKRRFCTITNEGVQEPWPKGSYCIYRNSNYCPPNMTQGFIDWYDEQSNNKNKFYQYSILPDGMYFGPTTRMLYCCHTTGKWYKSVKLPTKKPFYLLPYGSQKCQRVVGAVSSLEYIVYDTEDKNNWDEFDGHHVFTDKLKSLPKVYYCYYEGCQHKLRGHSGSFSSPNFLNKSYPDFQFCSWSIKVNASLKILLSFQKLLAPNCEENSLDIYEGNSAKETALLARLCGKNATSGAWVKSVTNRLLIIFKSGNNSGAETDMNKLQKRLEFHAKYEAIQEATPTTATRKSSNMNSYLSTKTLLTTPMSTVLRAPGTAKEIPLTKTKVFIASPKSLSTTTTATRKSSNMNSYLSTKTSLTTPITTGIGAPGEAKDILTKTKVLIGTPKSLSTTEVSTTNTYETGMMEPRYSSNESSIIHMIIALPVIAALMLLVVVGTIFYWRRHKKKDAAPINDKNATRV